ncbi:ATP-dependent RNA helicase [Vairimorpha necatrix]|uniref:RNA helicase n=1 Tax=Vairimorpha necatrix TaxID=6039 RepID=A0AAX4JE70_9MICR
MFTNEKKEIEITLENVKLSATKKIVPIADTSKFNKTLSNNIKLKFENFNIIQQYTIPVILEGGDLICKAPTGSGKTLCYIIPIISKIIKNPDSKAVIICPVRELCEQIKEVCRELTSKILVTKSPEANDFYYRPKLSNQSIIVSAIYGQKRDMDDLNKANILIATPGRLIDNLTKKLLNFNKLEIIVFDEADRLYDSTFKSQIDTIKSFITKDVQTCMFSATYPMEIQSIFDIIIKKDRTCIDAEFELKTNVKQEIYNKFNRLDKICRELKGLSFVSNWRESLQVEKVIIFVERKFDCLKLANDLSPLGFSSVTLHGDKNQFERNEALKKFKSSSSPILIATSVAARGIDIKDIKLVINYDLPRTIDEYIHRIGRTGRAGEVGKSISFYDENTDYNISGELIKVLKDTDQKVPEFLVDKSYKKNQKNFKIVKNRSDEKNKKSNNKPKQRNAEAPKRQDVNFKNDEDFISSMITNLNIKDDKANSEDEELGAW